MKICYYICNIAKELNESMEKEFYVEDYTNEEILQVKMVFGFLRNKSLV